MSLDDYDLITLHDGTVLNTHGRDDCAGQNCCVHQPSLHALRDAPLVWWPMFKIMVRRCEHAVQHLDPDDRAYSWLLVHAVTKTGTCDGCCGGTCDGSFARH